MMIITFIFSMCINLYAKTITVDTNYPSIGDYQSIMDAHNNADPGDTILVYPSQTTYSGGTVSKKLHIIGAGFGHDFSKDGVYPTTSTSISFSAGSEESTLEGFEISSITIRADNVMIRHNRISSSVNLYANNVTIKSNECSSVVNIYSGYKDNIIKQNRFIKTSGVCITVYSDNRVTISNNIIITSLGNSTSHKAIVIENLTNVAIINNYIEAYYPVACSQNVSGIVVNNIINSPMTSCAYIEHSNNISSKTSIPEGNGNILNVDLDTVFVDRSSYDFHLSSNSPALGSGYNGDDMGIYGGTTPYLDRMNLPESAPSVIHLSVPTMVPSGSNNLKVSIEAKSGNNN